MSDVAALAGVSSATVSRVLNNNATVDPEYAERVRAAAEQLGYRPNIVARSLRKQSGKLISLIISDVANPFFTSITRGAEDVAQRAGYSILLCNADEDFVKEATYLSIAEQQRVAGVILSPHRAGSDVSRLLGENIPIVVVDRPLDEQLDSVMVNSVGGAKEATNHLLQEGWTRPACITGPEDATTAQQRLQGYLDVIRERGGEELFTHAPFRQSGGLDAARELLDLPNPPDAFFIANTQMALGVLDELLARGIRVGVDCGIITFDEAPWSRVIVPPMSVVAQPAYQIGSNAATLLLSRIDGSEGPPVQEVLETELIVRASSLRDRG